MDMMTVILSRMQFAMTIGFHFLFVPITLGLTLILALMESLYVKTNNPVYKEMVKYWGVLFGIQFAMGVATGVPMEFQFGTNWSYYSHYVGDIFGAPLAIEGLMAFFLEATFVGMFFFGWERLSKVQHLVVTWLVCLGTNLSGLWILVANGWMQSPVSSYFDVSTMRMELLNIFSLILNPMAQAAFLHTVGAGYMVGSVLVSALSCMYLLLKKGSVDMLKKSIQVSAIVGIVGIAFTIFAGDYSGVELYEKQPSKLAAIEGMWKTEPAPASFNLFAIPLDKEQKNILAIKIPYVLGPLVTHSFSKKILGIDEIISINEQRIKDGLIAYKLLPVVQNNKNDKKSLAEFKKHSGNLGYALLLKRYRSDILNSTKQQINMAARDTVPNSLPLFFAFRIMVAIGFAILFYFLIMIYLIYRGTILKASWFHKIALFILPLPSLSIYCGWFVTEYGRQPWVIFNILPTFLAASRLPTWSVALSLIGFIVLYSIFFVINVYLTVKHLKAGPNKKVDFSY